ncbi:response regulator [Qipengyuania qiaonensis]|uniref:Response regulator n=1 Tax=Qipengyuania qiaonensis TaxID=2867240 RepID=A0ABS7JEA4_9SPHN|nr:response regulator [Qipengyuania qiaonensis]MBX7483327.1 response regulator [Qipengyuania qiaonensis]
MTSKPTILIVEDEALIRLSLIEIFEDAGFVVLDADSASSAEKMLDAKSESISILLTDIRLGAGRDGWDVARHARSKREDLPIVFVSGDSTDDWKDSGIERSVMLAKPVRDDDLLGAVSEGLAGVGRA